MRRRISAEKDGSAETVAVLATPRGVGPHAVSPS